MSRSLRRIAVAATGVLALAAGAACSSPDRPATAPPAPAAAPPAADSPVRLVPEPLAVPSGLDAAPFDRPRTVQLPRSWHASVWARVPGARLEAWTPDGRLLVSRPGSGDVLALTPRGAGAPIEQTLVAGLTQPHGLAFRGDTVYIAESDQVDAYSYGAGRVGDRQVVVAGLPDSKSPQLHGRYAHALKSVVVGGDGALYVSVGSTGNISAADRAASPPRAVVLRWDPSSRTTTVFATGVRNGTALGVDPSGAVWAAVNNRDQMPYPYHRDVDGDGADDAGTVLPAYVADHPLEPVAKLTRGRDLGWPYCDPDPSVEPGGIGAPLAYAARPFVNDPETNPTGGQLDCAALPPIEQGLPAHAAPLGLTFTTLPAPLGAGALVASHGSWNRTPPQPPSVAFLPWRDGTLGDAAPVLAGFQDADGSRWGRTVDVVAGPDHALYVSDDQAGAIYRVTTG